MNWKTYLTLVLAVPLAVGACSEGEAQNAAAKAAAQPRLSNVEVMTVRTSDLEEYLTLPGYTEAVYDVVLASELGGTVKELKAERGEMVHKGQILARVSADLYEAQLAEAQANLKLREAGLNKAKTLYERGSISAMQRLQAQTEHDVALAAVELATSRLERAVVTAPFEGHVDERYVDQGEMVSPGGQLLRIVDRSRLKIRCELAELDVASVNPGITAELQFDAFPDTVFHARLAFVAGVANSGSRTFPCEFELDNVHGLIRGGMHAKVRVIKSVHRNVLVLPQTALVETESGRNVFVLEGENVHRRPVTVSVTVEGKALIASGLQAEETVVVTGQRDLVDGQQVKVTAKKD